MLMYSIIGGVSIVVIVALLFAMIRTADGNEALVVSGVGEIEQRNYPTWEMGFEKVNLTANSAFKDFFTLDRAVLARDGDINNHMLLDFMKSFYTHL